MYYHFEAVITNDVRSLTEIRYRLGGLVTFLFVGLYLLLDVYGIYQALRGYWHPITPIFHMMITALLAMLPYISICREYNKRKKFYQGQIPPVIVRFGQQIYLQTVDSTAVREFAQIAKVHSLRYSYCLEFTDERMLILQRNGFTQGTFQDFKQFMRTVRPDLSIPE